MSRRGKEVRVGLTKRPAVNLNAIDQNTQNKRLKPLYDAIDAGQCRNAIDIADKMVRKFGTKDRNNVNDRVTVTTAKALKALANIRTDNTTEAATFIENAETAMLTDEFNEGTLQVLFHCFKESYVPNRIPILLEKVLRTRVASESLLNELYSGYARICDYKNQQRVANLLYKDNENPKYLLWSATSVVMQALTSPALAEKICFPLAKKMFEKALIARKPTRAEIQLYFTVLWKRGEIDKAIAFLTNAFNRSTSNEFAISAAEYNRLIIEALSETQNFERLASFAEQLLKKTSDDWQLWKALMLCFGAHMRRGERIEAERVLASISSLLEQLPQAEDSQFTRHDALLVKNMTLLNVVQSEYAKREELNLLLHNFGSCVENCKILIDELSNRFYCFKNISAFFPILSDADKRSLVEHIETDEQKAQITQVGFNHAFLLCEQLRVAAGYYDAFSLNERREYAVAMLKRFDRVDAADVAIDEYAKVLAILLANVYWQSYAKNSSSYALYELAVALEHIYDRCSNAYIAGLIQMRIYSIFGNMQRIMSLFNRLDIKYIQRDSLGYLTFTSAMQFGRFKDAIYYYTSMTTQFDQNERETSESIVVANRVCSLDKIPQLAGFLERCRNSIYARGADVLNQMLSACFAVGNLNLALITLCGDEERIAWNSLHDPRDFDVIECFALREQRPLHEIRRLSFNETRDYIKLHFLLGRALGDMGKADALKLNFDANCAALQQHYDYCKAVYTSSECSQHLAGFSAPALVSLVQTPIMQPIFTLLDIGARMMDVQSKLSATTLLELLDAIAPILQAPTWSLLLATVSMRNCDNGGGDATSIDALKLAAFIAQCSQALMVMTLAAMLLRFMEARAEYLVSAIGARTTLDKKLADATLGETKNERSDVIAVDSSSHDNQSVDYDPELSEVAQSQQQLQQRADEATNAAGGGKKTKRSKTRTFEEMNVAEKIPESFRLAYQNLAQTSTDFNTRVQSVLTSLERTQAFGPPNSRLMAEPKLSAVAANLDESLLESHRRTLSELILYTKRITTVFRTQPFQLMSVRFVGQSD